MFSTSETLSTEYKYYCEECCSKQEATKRLRVKRLPQILALHLKRFKYMEHSHRYTKLSHRVVFPWELKIFNTVSNSLLPPSNPLSHSVPPPPPPQSDDASNADRMYDLTAVVVHCGR